MKSRIRELIADKLSLQKERQQAREEKRKRKAIIAREDRAYYLKVAPWKVKR